MRCPPPPCRRWCPPYARRRTAQCFWRETSCWLQISQNMSEEAIVESLHSVFSRPMALVPTARLHAALCAANVRRHAWLQVWGKVAAAMGIACSAAASSHAADNARIVRPLPSVPALPVPHPLCCVNRPTVRVICRCGCAAARSCGRSAGRTPHLATAEAARARA